MRIAPDQLAQPVQSVVERVARCVAVGVWPQYLRKPVNRHCHATQSDRDFEQIQRLAAFFARQSRRWAVVIKRKAAQGVDADWPRPVFTGMQRRGQLIAPNQAHCERRINVVFNRKASQPRHHVATGVRHRSKIVSILTTHGKPAPQRRRAALGVALSIRQIGLNQPGKPMVPNTHGIEAVCNDGFQCVVCFIKITRLGGAEHLT